MKRPRRKRPEIKLVRRPGKVTQSLPGPGQKVGHFIPVPKSCRRSGVEGVTGQSWSSGNLVWRMLGARVGPQAGWPGRRHCRAGVREREGGSADEGEGWLPEPGTPVSPASPGLKEHPA